MIDKINVGCELCLLPTQDGWGNYDSKTKHSDVTTYDIRKGIPFPDHYLEIIYGGNFFDHLTYFEGLGFLCECHRALKTGGKVLLSIMDTKKIIFKFLYRGMADYRKHQPPIYSEMDNSTMFGVFLLGNLAQEKEYTGHKMLYTGESIDALAKKTGFKEAKLITPDFSEQPWCVENPEYRDHVMYVEIER